MQRIRPLILNAEDVAASAPSPAEIIAIVERTYRAESLGGVEVPPKLGVHPGRVQNFLHAMPAWIPEAGALGLKWISCFPGNLARALPDYSGIIILNDPDSGLPLAIMEGMWITFVRTGACAAVAVKFLASAEPRRLGLVGCGGLGRRALEMIAAICPTLGEVFVASRRPETRRAFCDEMGKDGRLRLTPVDDVREAVAGMDIVVSSVPKIGVYPIRAEWWSPGTLLIPLDVVGAWDDAALALADHLVCDSIENLRNAMERFRPTLSLDEKQVQALQQFVSGERMMSAGRAGRTMAFVTGVASHDMAIAWEVFQRAQRAGRGIYFNFT